MRVDAAAAQAAVEAVSRAAKATGVDFAALLATAKRESGLDGKAKAATSSAAGLFQFIEGTWLEMVGRYGPKHGLQVDTKSAEGRKAALALRFDPEISARMAGELTRENAAALAAGLGRAATQGEIYAAHVLGAQGALAALRAPPGTSAAALLPKAAEANRSLFYDSAGAPRSAQALLAKLSSTGGGQATPASPPEPASLGAMGRLAAEEILQDWGADIWRLALRAYRGPGR